MNPRMPQVSVIIPTFNRAHLLPRAVTSVLLQTKSDFELIIVDDGSIDNTKEWVEKLTDPRIRYIRHHHNLGQNAALNTGVGLALGEYVAFLDSDDEWLPEFLDKLIQCFTMDLTIRAVYSWAGVRMLDNSIKVSCLFSLTGNCYNETLAQGYLSHMITLMVKRDIFDQTGLFDTDFTVCQDDDFCFRVARQGKIGLVPEVLALIHSDDGNQRIITQSKLNYAAGWWKLFSKYRDEILTRCGCEVLAFHYIKCGKLFLDAGDIFKALDSFSLSAQYLDYCISQNLPLPAENIRKFVPEREEIRRQQVEGLKLCVLKALQNQTSV